MKKTLLTLVLALAFGVTCSAAVVLPTPKVKRLPLSTDSRLEFIMVPELAENSGRNQVDPLSRATESMNFTLADDRYTYVKLNGVVKGDQVASLMEFDKANTETFAGNEITAFFVDSPVNGELENENTIRNATVFITEDLGEEPFYTQDVRFGYKAQEKNFFPLEEAYKIEAGKPFFIGIKYTVSSNYDYYFPVDYLYHDSDAGGYCGVCKQGETEWTWNNLTSEIGFICQGVTITGDNLPHDDANIVATAVSDVLTKDKEDYYLALIRNNAANEISNVEVTTKVGNQAAYTRTITLDSPIGYGSTSVISVDGLVCETLGVNIPMTSTITKINGQPNNNTSSYKNLLTCMDENAGYPRKVVIEEATGTWCGFCPLGYSTMEAMREYDDVVPVAVHAGSDDEPMLSTTYSRFAHENFTGYPSAIMNRYLTVNIQSLDAVKESYEEIKATPSVANVSISFVPNDDWSELQLTASATFAFDFQNDNVFQFAYVLTEDNVGPYAQRNYLSGQSSYPEWSGKPDPVLLYFNDVARDIKDVYGFSNSLPDNITKGQTVTHSTTMSTANVSDVKNMNVAVYLINTYTGAIENAAMIKAADVAGVTNAVVEDDNVTVTTVNGGITVEGDVENVDVYGIDGRHVAHSKAAGTINLAGGLYIVKANDTTVKVVVK